MDISGQSCWLVAGPALDLYRSLEPKINDLLERHKELIEQGEVKPRMTSWNMLMIGTSGETAQPTIVFASRSRRQRQYAKALLKDSDLLAECPSVRIKTMEKSPAELRAAYSIDSQQNSDKDEHGLYLVHDAGEPSGSLISIERRRLATLGGVVKLNDKQFGFTAQHASQVADEEESPVDTGVCAFDDDSDVDEDELVEMTSRGTRGELLHSLMI